MASPDERFERWTLIEFLVAQNVKSIDILRRLLSVYGNVTQGSDISSVGRWALRTEGIEVGKAILSDHDRHIDGQLRWRTMFINKNSTI